MSSDSVSDSNREARFREHQLIPISQVQTSLLHDLKTE